MSIRNHYAAILLILLFCFSCQPAGEMFEGAIIIEHVNTIDPSDGLKEDQSLVIREGKIVKIAPSAQLSLSPENKIINGKGKYVIPGLWDAHVHFAYIEELAPRMFELFLAYGITSVRDTGGKIDFVSKWKKKALENPQNAPRVKIAGPLLDGMPNVYDGSSPMRPELSVGSATVEELEAQIRSLHAQGVDLLKAYEMLTPEQFKTVTKLGKELGLPVTGHVPLSMDVSTASNAGLNSMEHMRNLELSSASNAAELWEERKQMLADGKDDAGGDLRSLIHSTQRPKAIENYDEAVADKVLAVLAKNETWQVPTLALSTGMTEQPFSRPAFQESFQYLPDTLEQNWRAGAERVSKVELSDFNKAHSAWMFNMVGKVHEAGIDIMAGTDCPIFFLTPGRSLHEELSVLVKAGLSPLDAIKSATLNPATYFGMENELGSIKENMWADLLILNANPLEDINNSLSIETVIREGKVYDRNALDNMLKKLDQDD